MFDDHGGWISDPQFMEQCGSTQMLAHGLGHPVNDAVTHFEVTLPGEYKIYVRTRNWTSRWSDRPTPGAFRVLIDGADTGYMFGTGSAQWSWDGGVGVSLAPGHHELRVHDLHGFDARFDTVLLTRSDEAPDGSVEGIQALREALLPSAALRSDAGHFDFVVMGGGCAGMCAALAAARSGLKVALIQDRKVLGGNNSSEVRVGLGGRLNIGKYPALGYLLNEFGPARKGNARPADVYEDDKKLEIILKEPNVRLLLGYKVVSVHKEEGSIKWVEAEQTDDYSRLRVSGDLFADCTGDGTPGVLAGAGWAMGRESSSEFGEPSAPEVRDGQTLGASLQWYCEEDESPVTFPDIDWGLEMDDSVAQRVRRGQWYWEVGMRDDQMAEAEMIRDYGMYVAYSNWSWLKNHASYKDEYSHSRLAWVCHVLGKRESRRLVGLKVLTENDLTIMSRILTMRPVTATRG